jgi:hypothetical protein
MIVKCGPAVHMTYSITNKFKIKSSVPYDIMLSEMGVAPIEAIAMVCLIRYLKKIEQMEDGRLA